MIKVGQEKITAKRNLGDIFPSEITNRKIFNEYIQYILNNYFEKSKEKMVSSYVGCVVDNPDGIDTYLKEPTAERQLNQIIPVLKSGSSKITFNNYLADLHNEGCTIYDQNKLLASKYWSWCPPIDADAFINFNNYVWIGYPYEEDDIKVLNGYINVKDEFIDKKFNIYREYNERGEETYSYEMQTGDIVVFPNDTSLTYNAKPYKVQIDRSPDGSEITKVSFISLTVPLIIIAKETNISTDIIGKKNYTMEDSERDFKFDLVNGMRIRFLNDANSECNNISYIVQGVGEYIQFVDDSYNPYKKEENHSTKDSIIFKPDYFVMERGSIDGNDWSRLNRWVQRKALEAMNIASMELKASDGPLNRARRPIIIFNRDIELYNSGSFDRGIVKYALNMKSGEINGTREDDWEDSEYEFENRDRLLMLGNVGSSSYQLYSVRIVDGIIYLDILTNGQTDDGSSVSGDTVKVNFGDNAGKVLYYDGYGWKEGQVKRKINQMPLFNLYDTDKIALNNSVTYPNSTFEGCTLFQYKESEVINIDKDVEVSITVDEEDSTNVYFESTLVTGKYFFTPPNDYEKEITGYRLYRNIREDSYLNDWHLSSVSADQYLRTRIEVYDDGSKYPFVYVDKESYEKYSRGEEPDFVIYEPTKEKLQTYIDNMEKKVRDKEAFRVYVLNLKYKPIESTIRNSLVITNNDKELSSEEIIKDKDVDTKYYLRNVDIGDVLVIKLLPENVSDVLDEDYSYDYPLSLTVNQFNKDIGVIGYNDCFDQMTNIIKNQVGLIGSSIGSNNYSSLVPDVSVGTKIVQTPSSVIRSMILNNNSNTSIRASILYALNAYAKFKQKFINLIEQENIKGNIIDNEDAYAELDADHSSMDKMIVSIIKKINIGKEGLMPFYNNGVLKIMDNAYVPSTPAYLGISNCCEPRIEEWEGYTLDIKPLVVVGHDGSLTRATHSVKDLYLLRLEELIYESIENKFKDTRCGLNIYPYMPGKFRENTYSRQEVLDSYSPMFEKWCSDQNITYTENNKFTYESFDVEPNCWKTWNYTGCEDKDGVELFGSYRSVYMYYYDTYRPDTHPWEMLGFGEKPSWWEEEYGEAPYTSENILMWKDIENGIIKKGPYAGEYDELKRPGLFETYLPVDEDGKLKNPVDANIIREFPTVQQARKKWVIGDIGDVEFAYLQTSDSKFVKELVKYMLRPVDWVETNWNTLEREVLFQGTDYEQIIDALTNTREDISKMVMHNEYINGDYVRKIGMQQWISDYLTSNTISITNVANAIRTADVCLGYRCAGFYQKGTVEIVTDTYGVLPEENVHINLINSKRERIFTYSGMTITKSKRGYVIDGFDMSDPYFRVRLPDTTGKKSTIDANGKTFYYYHHYKKNVTKIPYRTEYLTMQEVYDVINGYGKYLTENENWYFSTLAPNGTVLDFRTGSETFANWATALKGPETENALLLINPGSIGIGNYNDGIVTDLKSKISGFATVRDIYDNPVESTDLDVFRQAFNTYFSPKDGINVALIKFKTYDLEHLITFDNTTIYNDVIYNSLYSAKIERFKIYGIKVLNWYGTVYAPGYIIQDDGAIPNYDKTVNDLQYIFDVDDVHCVGKYAEYSRGTVGYRTTKTYKDLYQNEKSMFDFYKGAIRHKGTKGVLEKMNRSTNISSTGNNIELYEIWGFREGQFGHIKDNSVDEFILDSSKMIQNPQIITFETSTNYYFDKTMTYNLGDICIYNNYEYMALRNDITGKFVPEDWKKIRYVGNYIIFDADPNWIKKSNAVKVNCFKYTDNLLINPIGGFAKTDECSYIVPTEEDANNLIDTMEIGETVWIVKTDLGDWDVRKKTGVNKLVSMRYFSIKDAMSQPEEEFIYHFRDDNLDYYSKKTSENIELKTPVYSDIDVNDIACKWGDIGIPEYTGETSEYIVGQFYKVKLYNTIFLTQSKENELNNGTPFRDLYNSTSVSYSDLLLHMAEFGHNVYKFKWKFKLKVDTKATDVKVVINGYTYDKPEDNTVELIVTEGDIINWKVSAHGCGERTGKTIVNNVDEIVYTKTKEQIEALSTAQKREYNLIQKLSLNVALSYRRNAVIYKATSARDLENIRFEKGYYDIEFVGAGGGAGGATSCTHHHHNHPGCGGASGAYLNGRLTVTDETSDSKKYTIVTGKGGAGGQPGHHSGTNGLNGGDTGISLNGKSWIYAQSGAGGLPSRRHATPKDHFTCGGRACGYGGKLKKFSTTIFDMYDGSRNGNDAGFGLHSGPDALSVYPVKNYGRGGTGVDRAAGKNGYDGFGKVVYKDVLEGETYNEYKSYSKFDVTYISMETASSDSMEYSSYYQPYIQKYTDDTDKIYFYSYDVLYNDEVRPNANVVNSGSAFFLNRSRSITAYHNSDVIKNQWVTSAPYNIGDKVTYNGKYYICMIANTQDEFTEYTGEGDERITYWEEYAPTYYYKITYNNGFNQDAVKPTYNNGEYRLYEDADCTIPVSMDSEPFYMSCKDLQLGSGEGAKGYNIGENYTLVDQFATYNQISPQYLNEPSWSAINQIGTYEITSGKVDYYVNSDEATIKGDETSLVYKDITCRTPVKSIVPKLSGDTLTYKTEDMKYSDIINTIIDVTETSYELRDKDIYLYTNVPESELTEDTVMYNEFELEEEKGVYRDYIPVWEKTSLIPNGYKNNIHYIDYAESDNSNDLTLKTYVTKLLDNNGNITDFYWEFENKYHPIFAPSKDKDGKLYHSTKLVYTLNKYIVDTYDSLSDLSAEDGDICRVKSDVSTDSTIKTSKMNNVYYQKTNSGWNRLGTFTDVPRNLFNQYNNDIYVQMKEDTSILYPDLTYQRSNIDNSVTVSDNGVNNTVNLYFNNQSVGKHITTNTMISDRGEVEEIKIFCFDCENDFGSGISDPMYNFVCEMISAHGYNPDYTPRELYLLCLQNYAGEIFYIDEVEAISLYEYANNDIGMLKGYFNSDVMIKHRCKSYDMYRNIDGKAVYTRMCLYGDKFYAKKLILDEITSQAVYAGILYGDITTISNYDRIDYNYSTTTNYNVGDICVYEDVGYECISQTRGTFKPSDWELYVKDKIVNVISYRTLNDIIYVTSDNYNNRIIDNQLVLSDTDGNAKINGSFTLDGKNGWMKMKYIDQDYMFNLIGCERKRLNVDTVKSCYLVDNSNDDTIVQVQVFDPIQNIIPNNILNEINYISSTDPVNDYTDAGKWSESKVGFLWWDTSKVRYVDYYQGDYEYRRNNWGKQLPGSEIAIMEWTKSVFKPDETDMYVERSIFNYETSSVETYYYYWKKNPITIPELSFRTTSAYHIAEIINDPTAQGIIWMSPIDTDVSGRNDNTLIITNFSDVMTGQEAVLQLNTDSDKEIMDHSEWVEVKENTNNDIPDWLWEKMRDSLLGYRNIEGVDMPVPDQSLKGRQRLGIAFRPRQTMFDNLYNARENFIDAINITFKNRTEEEMMIDLNSGLNEKIDSAYDSPYYDPKKTDEATTMLELMSWKDENLIGENILVKHDETHDNIWVIYHINKGFTYSILDYQKYNIKNYINYEDWYENNSIKYLTPVYTETVSEMNAKNIASGKAKIPGARRYIKEGEIVKFEYDEDWKLYKNVGDSAEIVGASNSVMQIDKSLYDYVNQNIDDKETYIELFTENADGTLTSVKTLTKYDYIFNETQELFKILIDYLDVEETI